MVELSSTIVTWYQFAILDAANVKVCELPTGGGLSLEEQAIVVDEKRNPLV